MSQERPILFKAPMVRAILDGTKTQTRRVVKRLNVRSGMPHQEWMSLLKCCPHGQPGDRLWVRETWQGPLLDSEEHEAQFRDDGPSAFQNPGFCAYRATDNLDAIDADGNELGWRPSIHMPRWASRILLKTTAVRVERLQDISRGDAMDEGCPFPNMAQGDDPRKWYAELWESINGPGSWDVNPWVWVVEFERVQS